MTEIPITPATIMQRTFRIPLYQRPYAWEEQQVDRLLTDLLDAFEDGKKSGKHHHYHIGILSVSQTTDDSNCYDLIDGQQRITTLMLIGKALLLSKTSVTGWRDFTTPGRLDLYGREGDKKFLENGDASGCNQRMTTAVISAEDFLSKKLDPTRERDDFAQYIYNYAAFFLSEVPTGYSLLDKNQQFVRMNNRGKQLEKHEILKCRLLAKMVVDSERTKAFDIWNEMTSCLTGTADVSKTKTKRLSEILKATEPSKEESRHEILYTAIVTVPEFLLIALARWLPPGKEEPLSFNVDKLLETFSILREPDEITTFINILKGQVKTFRSYFIFLSKQDKYEIGGGSASDTDFEDGLPGRHRLIAAQSFLHVSTQPHHWIISAIDWCDSATKPIDPLKFVEHLEKTDTALNDTNNSDSGLKFRRNILLLGDLSAMTYRAFGNYWFYRLDYELWKLYQVTPKHRIWENLPKDIRVTNLVKNFHFRKCGSVEHIDPQKKIDSDADADHSFGNLALISSSRNSKFSNNPRGGKMDMILGANNEYTESLKMVHALWCDSNPETHGQTMYNILKASADGMPFVDNH